MPNIMRICIVGVTTLATLCLSRNVAAEENNTVMAVVPTVPGVAIPVMAQTVMAAPLANFMGVPPLDVKVLAKRRGAADVYNDMQLKGVVSDNRAVNVATGNNIITDGAFGNASGVPMVVQNSGNNVLIQNATILNIQVK